MKKFFLVLFAVLLALSFTACRNVVYIPIGIPGGGDSSENTGGDEEAERAENLQAAGEVLAGIETLFQSYIDEGRKADTYESGPSWQKGSIPVGQTLTYDLGETFSAWTYSLEIVDREFSVDQYMESEDLNPDNLGDTRSIFDGIVLVSYYKEGQTTDDGSGPLGGNAYKYGEKAIRVEFKKFDLIQMMLNPSSITTLDTILIDGKTLAETIGEAPASSGKLYETIFENHSSVLNLISSAFNYNNSFAELKNHPGFGESHKLNEFVFNEENGLSYTYIWDFPNTGFSAVDFSVSDGSLKFYVTEQLYGDNPAEYTIERFEFNGISYTESELEGFMIGEMSARDYVLKIFNKSMSLP